jgi:hypothetical protein
MKDEMSEIIAHMEDNKLARRKTAWKTQVENGRIILK